MIAAHHNRWQNLNKIILNEFKSKWEEVIMYVDILLRDSEWLETMWLHVIGCPS